jgi:AraC-like DNA-binding protein
MSEPQRPPGAGKAGVAPAAPAPAAVPSVLFTIDGMPHAQRLDAWNARFRSINTISVQDPATSSLSCRNENRLLGDMLFSASSATASRFERHPRQVRQDGLDHWVLRVMRMGRSQVRIGDARHDIGTGQPLLFSLADAWVCDWADSAWVSLCLPRDAFPELSAGLASLGTGPPAGPGVPLLADYLLMLEQHLRGATADRVPALADATRAMVCACLLRNVAPRAVTAEAVALAQFERVRALVRHHLASPMLNAERLARMVGMSRSALYRLMEPHGGVASYIRALRLRVAHALLSDPALAAFPIATLGERVGFFDPSAFSRSFRAAFGYSPREARAAALAGMRLPGIATARPQTPTEEDFGSLLRRVGAGSAAPISAGAARAQAP